MPHQVKCNHDEYSILKNNINLKLKNLTILKYFSFAEDIVGHTIPIKASTITIPNKQ